LVVSVGNHETLVFRAFNTKYVQKLAKNKNTKIPAHIFNPSINFCIINIIKIKIII